MRGRFNIHRAKRAAAPHTHSASLALNLDARRSHLVNEGHHVRQLRAGERDIPVRDNRGGGEVRARFDSIRNDGVIEWIEFATLRAFDVDDIGARAVHASAHLVEDPSELFDLWSAGAAD